MRGSSYDENDFTPMVLKAVASLAFKKDIKINYLYKNDSYSYDYDGDNETYATNENNHQFLDNNYTFANITGDKSPVDVNNYWALLAIGLVFGTACGNILVCLAIAWEKRLQNVTNYFLASLAITDLMVAILVMPLGIVTLFRGKRLRFSSDFDNVRWYFSSEKKNLRAFEGEKLYFQIFNF